MTVKEVEEKLTRMCKREYDLGNVAGGFAYDMAQLLVREIKDRSEEMIEWMRRRREWNHGRTTDFADGYGHVVKAFLEYFKDKPKEQGMTLQEIAKEAKEGDQFGRPGWNSVSFDSATRDMVWHEKGGFVGISKEDILANDWHFTHRPNHCPHCGKVIDDA